MNNVRFYDSKDVSGNLKRNYLMTKDFEILGSPDEYLTEENIFLSKGASEEDNPLPVINFLSRRLFQLLEEDATMLDPDNNPDLAAMKQIFWDAAKELQLIIDKQIYKSEVPDEAVFFEAIDWLPSIKLYDEHSSLFGYRIGSDFGNSEFLKKVNSLIQETWEQKRGMKEAHEKLYELFINRGAEKYHVHFTSELIVLLMILASCGNHKRILNKDFYSMYKKHEKYCERTLNIHRNVWAYIQKKRAQELSITPNYFTIGHTEINGNSIPLSEVKIAFAAYPKDILQIAWAELIFAQIHEMPVGLCTFCGTVYRVGGKKGRGNHRQSTCGNPECQKKLRYQRDQEKKQKDPEEVRRKNRERQKKYQDKRKAIKLYNEGVTIDEIAKTIGRQVEEIREWIRS